MTDSIKRFESVAEYVDYLRTTPIDPTWENYDIGTKKYDYDWCFGLDMNQACDMAESTWEEGLKQVTKELAVIPQGEGRAWVNSVAGAYPIVPRFLAGNADCMVNRVSSAASKRPVIDMVISRRISCGVDAKSMVRYGIAIIELIDSLEKSGFQINLDSAAIASMNYGSDANHLGDIVNLKKAGESMDIGKMIFFIAHPASCRKMHFCFLQRAGKEHAVGHHMAYTSPENVIERNTVGAINMSFHNRNFDTVDEARREVNALFNRLCPNFLDLAA